MAATLALFDVAASDGVDDEGLVDEDRSGRDTGYVGGASAVSGQVSCLHGNAPAKRARAYAVSIAKCLSVFRGVAAGICGLTIWPLPGWAWSWPSAMMTSPRRMVMMGQPVTAMPA